MTISKQTISETRQRWFELLSIGVVTLVLAGISRLETRLYELSGQLAKDDSFIASIFFYGIINLNVFLAIILSFLVVRNIAKLVVERRRGVFGSRLRTKLVATLMIFALAPTVIVFYVSTRFINESFDEWFGGRVRETMQQARDAGGQIYLQDQRRLEGIARVAASRVKVKPKVSFLAGRPQIEISLDGFESEYGVYSVRVYDRDTHLLWSNLRNAQGAPSEPVRDRQLIGGILGRFATRPGLVSSSVVDTDASQDVVRAAVPLRVIGSGELVGIVLVEERFDMPFLKSLELILTSFSSLKPAAQLVRVSYLILITVLTLMIVFASVWFGFRVARAIIGPIQILAEATREVALGNYAITLNPQSDDETGQLMRSFNTMTHDLERHRKFAIDAQERLQESNDELERRRRYMEIVFANIAAGVIAVDSQGVVTAFNEAAGALLGLEGADKIGRDIRSVLGVDLVPAFWDQVVGEGGVGMASATREIDLRSVGIDMALFVAVTAVRDEYKDDLGLVLVFDDATERVKQQRVMAWREVASRIAHEIKNPITPIKLSAERLLRRFVNRFEGDDRDVFEKCVESILVQVDSLKNLVNEFGKFARMPAIQPTMCEIRPVIEGAVEVFKQGYAGVRFSMRVESALPLLRIDPEQINRAFVNVIGNAVDAVKSLSEGAHVAIDCYFDEKIRKVVVEIADNGPGIASEVKDRVFDPYVSSKDQGTGLGLAITSQIVSDHGGYVRIAHTGALGTMMRIELPVPDRSDV